MNRSLFAGGALAALGAFGGGSAALADSIDMIIYGTTGNPFWAKVVAGAEEAGEDIGVEVNIQFAADDPVQQNTLVEAAMARGTAGIGLVLNVDDAYDGIVSDARDAGIPVVSFNVDDSEGADGNGRMAFVGQDFEVAGYAIGQTMIMEAGIVEGDGLVCPVEHPDATYAIDRGAGVIRALEEVGATCEVIGTGAIGLEDTLTKLAQYLIANPDTKGVIGLGGLPTEVAPDAIEEAGMDIPAAGFDLSKAIIQNILDGRTIATVDQQPFYQGYLTVVQLHFADTYGLVPMTVNTGAAIIDQSNAQVVLDFADTVR
jgi:simple sugar transport system substrate-binding protein